MLANDNLITWIASYPKSGNTWIRALITAYANEGEVEINSIMQTGDKDDAYYEGLIQSPIKDWTITEQAMIKPVAMMRMLEDAAGNMLLKTHDANLSLSGVEQIPPYLTRSAIHIVRDPRDIVLSFMNHYNLGSVDATINLLLDDDTLSRAPDQGLFVPQLSWRLHTESWMREAMYPIHRVRYEDLLTQPFDCFKEIIQFIGMDFNADLLRKSIQATKFDRLQKQEETSGFREGVGQKFFHKGKSNRWKTELSNEHQQRIVEACEVEMKALSYL
ncbi:MAG: sulfotransferase domain-containing protein [Arenicellales bacterium]